jgi:cytochrome P450
MGIPYITPVPFFGNAKDRLLFRKSFSDLQQELYAKFDGHPVAGIFEGRIPILLIRDPEIIRNIMVRDFECFVDRLTTPIRPKSVNESMLLCLKGSEWRDVRHISTPIFTSGKMKAMSHLITDCTNQMINYLDKFYEGKEIEMKEFFGRFTLDVIASCAFGIQCDSLANPDAEFVKVIARFNELTLFNVIALILSVVVFQSSKLAKLLGVRFMNQETTAYLSKVVLNTKAKREVSHSFFCIL